MTLPHLSSLTPTPDPGPASVPLSLETVAGRAVRQARRKSRPGLRARRAQDRYGGAALIAGDAGQTSPQRSATTPGWTSIARALKSDVPLVSGVLPRIALARERRRVPPGRTLAARGRAFPMTTKVGVSAEILRLAVSDSASELARAADGIYAAVRREVSRRDDVRREAGAIRRQAALPKPRRTGRLSAQRTRRPWHHLAKALRRCQRPVPLLPHRRDGRRLRAHLEGRRRDLLGPALRATCPDEPRAERREPADRACPSEGPAQAAAGVGLAEELPGLGREPQGVPLPRRTTSSRSSATTRPRFSRRWRRCFSSSRLPSRTRWTPTPSTCAASTR